MTVTVTVTPTIQRGKKYNPRIVVNYNLLKRGMRVDHEGTTYIVARSRRSKYFVVASGHVRYWSEFHFPGKEELDRDLAAFEHFKRWLRLRGVPTKGLNRPSFC